MADTQMERKLGEGKRRSEEGIRSYINPGIYSVPNIVPKEEIIDDLSYSEESVTESNSFLIAASNGSDVPVKTELNKSFVYPLNVMTNACAGFGHYSEENDPPGMLENGAEDGVNSKELGTIHTSEFVKIEQIKLEQEFLSETSDVNTSTFACDSNEQSEVAKSPTYIIPQIIEETNHNFLSQKRCEFCGKNFKNNRNLKIHKMIHMGEKPYKCETCGKAFSKSNTLNEHQRRHTGERPYKCPFCEKAFTTSSELMRHKGIHTEEMPYKCRFCEKSCLSSTEMKIHERIHTGERPYKCDICEKAFLTSTALAQHLSIHTGVKPYKCDICGTNFARNSTLKRHTKTHTRGKL